MNINIRYHQVSKFAAWPTWVVCAHSGAYWTTAPGIMSKVYKRLKHTNFALCTIHFEHLYSPRMVEEIKEEKNGTSSKQIVIWPNYLKYLNYSV